MSVLHSAARPVMRRSGLPLSAGRTVARRFESDSASKAKETASKASEQAKAYQTKASQGLSRVTSSAGPALAGAARAASGLTSSLGKMGGPIGKTFSFIERQIPSAVYYSKVTAEVAKLVFQGQKMSPPSLQSFQSYWQNALQQMRNPSSLMQSASKTASQSSSTLQQARKITPSQIAAGTVLVAELLGFFTVGEIIGRFKLIGYHGGSHSHH